MSDVVLYSALVGLVTLLLAAILYLRQKKSQGDNGGGGGGGGARPRVPRPRVGVDAGGAAPPPNRVIAQRNARARMRAAQHQDEESEDEETNLGDDIALPDGKVGKKKLAKLQAKADRRVMREVEEREREERKERKEKAAEDRKKEEEKEAEEEAKREEEERKAREERARREQEEYEKMKAMFDVEEEGFDETSDEDKERNLTSEFVKYIKAEKVVVLEDLGAKFKLKAQDVINRVTTLQKEGKLTGVIDDRGKFIYISQQELEGVAKFIRQRGRVSLAELAQSSSSLITLTPDTPVPS